MRRDDDLSHEGPAALQPQQLAPAELSDFLPGAGQVPDPYAANRDPARIDTLLAGAKSTADTLAGKILAPIDARLAQIYSTVQQLEIAITGPIDALLTKTQKSAGKVLSKIVGKIDLHLNNAAANAYALGYRPKTPAEVSADLHLAEQTLPIAHRPTATVSTLPASPPNDLGTTVGTNLVVNNTTGPDADGWYDHPIDCPDGWALLYAGDTGLAGTKWKCVKVGTDTTTGGSGGGGLPGCPVGPPWGPFAATFATTQNGIYYGVQGYGVFATIDASTPPGTYILYQFNYVNGTTGANEFVQGWAQSGWPLTLYAGHLWYFQYPMVFGTAVSCAEEIRSQTVSGTTSGGGGGGGPNNCAVPLEQALGCGKKLNFPPLPALGDGECIDWNAWVQALLAWDPNNGGNGLVGQPANLAGTISTELSKLLYGGTQPLLPTFVNWGHKQLVALVSAMTTASGCNSVALSQTATFSALLEFLQKWTGIVPPVLSATLEQAQNNFCPYNLPEQAAADGSWLGGTIDDDTWECWTKSAGNLTKPAEHVRNAGRTRPNAAELSILYRRGLLSDDEFQTRLREVGVIRDEEGQNIFDLTAFLPSPIDIVRFMVRDVGDPAMIAKFGLDAKFDDKIKGSIVTYAKAAGVDEEVLLDFWRAHWVIPSYTQLVDMMFRLRPGRVPQAIEVTEDDVRQALNHNDVLPFWVDRLMQLARPVLNRTDLLLAFTERTITDDEFTDGLQDLGYTPENAKRFLATYSRQRKLRDARAAGLPTARRLVKLFADGLVTTQEMHDYAFAITVSRKQRTMLIDQADKARELAQRQCTVNAVKHQYVAGLLDDGSATAQLAKAEIEADEIPEMIKCWGPQRQAKGKVPGASQLCKWREQNLLTAAQQTAALVRMGWAVPDAARITESCSLDNATKLQKQADAAQKRADAAARKSPSALKAMEAAEQAELNNEARGKVGVKKHTKSRKVETTTPVGGGDATTGPTVETDLQTQDQV